MIHLILSLIAIAIVVAAMIMGAGSVPLKFRVNTEYEIKTLSGFAALSSGYHSYRITRQDIPDTGSWKDQISEVVYIPDPPGNLIWDYGLTDGRAWFCLKGQVSRNAYEGLQEASKRLSSQNTVFHADCGHTSPDAEPTSWPAQRALTYFP
ncbi:MAG: hypothetical protein U9N14_01795 [Pseudomonadota bacterium]|nr:hypothetical protein [Pseudomonadota bacterium]